MAIINGEEKKVGGKTLLQFLTEEGYTVERVVVERNLEIVPAAELETTKIEENDSIEVLNFVGGG